MRGVVSLIVSALAALILVAASATIAWGDEGPPSPDVMHVEEDWELVLTEPASIKTAPQIESVISPVGHIEGVFA
jgi:hypothetical protein